jgi:hypothetical protein
VNRFFIIFVHHRDAPGPPTTYRGDDGKVVVYDTRLDAESVAAELTATKQSPNISLAVTEFEPL